MSFKSTPEQNTCVTNYGKKLPFKVNAVAGSGKTSTIRLMAESDTRTGLYLAFNKTAASEAASKMPSHITCKTTHSIAYAAFGAKYRNKLSRPSGGYVNVAGTVSELVRYFKVKSTGSLSSHGIARLAKLTVAAFEASASFMVDENHIPQGELDILKKKAESKADFFDTVGVSGKVLKLAIKLWIERVDLNSPVLITHDTYLKLYQLSKPVMDYEVIFLDEAQDTSDCVIDIVTRQMDHAQVVCVGDSYQAIYGWRGAVNALGKIKSLSTSLSQSFRYGPEVANVATAILDGEMIVKGFDQIPTVVGKVDRKKPYTMLFRTNAALIEEGLSLITEGIDVDITVNIKDYVKKMEAMGALYNGNMKAAKKHQDICVFENWEELMEEVSLVKGELLRISKQVVTGEYLGMVRTLNRYSKPRNASIVLTTAHKSKGMEYHQVILANDFPSVVDDKGNYIGLSGMERNLLYVAATRAQGVLQLNKTALKVIEYYKGPFADTKVDINLVNTVESTFADVVSKHIGALESAIFPEEDFVPPF